MSEHLWWHAYGQVREDLDGCWQLVVVYPSPVPPAQASQWGSAAWGPWLASWDHAPSDAEKDAITPEEYRDEVAR